MKTQIFLIFILGSLFMPKSVNAQTQDQPPQKTIFYSVGIGNALIPEFEGAKDYRALPLVNFSSNWINGRYIRLNGLNTEVNILANRKWNFGPAFQTKINRNNKVENAFVAQLPKLNLAIGAGIFGQYTCKNLDIKGSYTHDISNVNQGGLLGVEIGYTVKKKKLISRFALSTSYATSNYLNSYFGVNDIGSSLSGLPTFELGSGFKDIGISSRAIYNLNKRWIIGSVMRYTILINEVKDSPIINQGSKHQLINALFAIYRF